LGAGKLWHQKPRIEIGIWPVSPPNSGGSDEAFPHGLSFCTLFNSSIIFFHGIGYGVFVCICDDDNALRHCISSHNWIEVGSVYDICFDCIDLPYVRHSSSKNGRDVWILEILEAMKLIRFSIEISLLVLMVYFGIFVRELYLSYREDMLSPNSVATSNELTINTIGMRFVLIPAGSFMMGCNPEVGNKWCRDNEKPQHRVIISKSFFLGQYEVTQGQWMEMMDNNPSHYKGRNRPVENVSWNDVQEFIQRLNEKEGRDKYRLPTEAEWEYAARAGTTSIYSFGNDVADIEKYAWYVRSSRGKSRRPYPVGHKNPNPWGLYDMHGNVWEWVYDWYDSEYYAHVDLENDVRGPSNGNARVFRGGGSNSHFMDLRTTTRGSAEPDKRYDYIGFRLVLVPGNRQDVTQEE
jgi:formylglycine-generating enzyme required for sulfatase activity